MMKQDGEETASWRPSEGHSSVKKHVVVRDLASAYDEEHQLEAILQEIESRIHRKRQGRCYRGETLQAQARWPVTRRLERDC